MTVKAIPDGFHSITPSLTVKGAAEAIECYKKAFGAEERMRFINSLLEDGIYDEFNAMADRLMDIALQRYG